MLTRYDGEIVDYSGAQYGLLPSILHECGVSVRNMMKSGENVFLPYAPISSC